MGILLILIIFGIPPFVITIINLKHAVKKPAYMYTIKREHVSELFTYVLGIPLSYLFIEIVEIIFAADWNETLSNARIHTPIWSGGVLTIAMFGIIGIISYIVMRVLPLSKTPPLITVLCMSGIYIGILICIFWMLQLLNHILIFIFLGLLPFNCIVLGIKIIRYKICQWNQLNNKKVRIYRNLFLNKMNQKLQKSENWPFYAFILMFPLLIICILVLLVFGQQPDAIIKAWTETSDWTLSTKEALPNIQIDEHYLCTVAAGGHEKIVKPERMGIRHGHRVVVNRQLCVANAFEQLISEKNPRFHKVVRACYDKYGFPIAKIIKSKYIADLIYFLMKPLEWLFSIALYLTDANPENRIAMQYIPPIPNEFYSDCIKK